MEVRSVFHNPCSQLPHVDHESGSAVLKIFENQSDNAPFSVGNS